MESYPASNLQSAVGFRKMLGDLILQSKLLWNAPSKTIQIDQLHSFESLRLLFPKEDSRFHPLNGYSTEMNCWVPLKDSCHAETEGGVQR